MVATAITTVTKCGSFSLTNGQKVENGQTARVAPLAAQLANGVEAYGKTSFCGANLAKGISIGVGDLAKGKNALGYGAKGLQWAQSHVNPLIAGCVAIKVLTADDKEKAFCEDVPGLFGMFGAEKCYKALAKTEDAKNIFSTIEKYGNKMFKNSKGGRAGKILAAVTEGLGFVAVSIGGYAGAAKVGGTALEYERSKRIPKMEKLDAMC